ncbi:MAG: hypothetical protein V3W20_06910 [Candidatus Neomarinimicrobiota bacterium]
MLKKLKYLGLIFIALLLFIILFLAYYDRQSKEVYLIRNTAKFEAIVDQCNALPAAKLKQNQQCIFALKLYNQVVELSKDLLTNQEQYGRNILLLQIRQGKLKSQIVSVHKKLQQKTISAANRLNLNKKLQQYQWQFDVISRQIKTRLALLAEAEGM